jgi:hypothetical protein
MAAPVPFADHGDDSPRTVARYASGVFANHV